MIKQSETLNKAPDHYFKDVPAHNNGAFTPHVYEIHGNVLYMHCSEENEEVSDHVNVFEKLDMNEVKDRKNHVPKCKKCGLNMKPHCMFFDEAYSETFYRKESVTKFYEDADCCIVVGTALATNFALRIVNSFLKRELPVIEINLETSIDKGNNLQVLGKAEVTLPVLFKEFYRLKEGKPEEGKEESKVAGKDVKPKTQNQKPSSIAKPGVTGAKPVN